MKFSRIFLSAIFALAFIFGYGMSQTNVQQSREVILGGYNFEPAIRTSASGLATVTVHKDTLKVSGDFSDLTGYYMGAYIMIGKKGETGNMMFRLKTDVSEDRTGGVWEASKNIFTLSNAQRQLIQAGELYILVTSSDHSHGELRGQIPPMK